MKSVGQNDRGVVSLVNNNQWTNRAIVEAKSLLETLSSPLHGTITSEIAADNRRAKDDSTKTDLTMPSFFPFIGSFASSFTNASSPMYNMAA